MEDQDQNQEKVSAPVQAPAPHVHGPGCSHGHSPEPFVRATLKVGRNDPCPCGSELKYKKCHGQGQ